MSLYNQLFGFNPFAGLLLQALDVDPRRIPRFRDCYLTTDGRICIYSRTGGSYREAYGNAAGWLATGNEKVPGTLWHDDLRALPGFVEDRDDDFDTTFVSFFYEVPESFRPLIESVRSLGAEGPPPEERFKKLIEDMETGRKSAASDRATEVGKQLFDGLLDHLKR